MGKNEICSECVHNVHLLKRSWQEAKKKQTNYQYYSHLFAVVLLLGSQAPLVLKKDISPLQSVLCFKVRYSCVISLSWYHSLQQMPFLQRLNS